MKKVLLVMSAAFILCACGGNDKTPEVKKDSATTAVPKPTPAPPNEKMLELIASKNCAPACHAIDKKVIGPAYIDVAKKYESTPENIAMLAEKVIKGGKGVWGDIPMTPNTTVTPEEAKELVTYILSLKNNQ